MALPLSLLGMLMRPKKKYQVPLVETVKQSLQDLSIILADDEDIDVDSAMLAIHTLFLTIWTTSWMPQKDNTIPCVTQRCLALRSLRADRSFNHPNTISPEISRLEYPIRLTFLRQIHILATTKYKGNFDLARIEMQPWFTEKVHSPFNTLRSLKHRASAITYNTRSLPRSVWTDRTTWSSMLYKGNSITMGQIQQVFANLEDITCAQWENKVLCGLSIRVDYTSIADDLTNTDVGYSFLTDPRNTMFHSRDRLALAILQDPKLRAHFTIPATDGEGIIWSRPAMQEWLINYSQFSGYQATRTEMLAGAPGRSTELHAMNYCNTPTRTSRNLLALDKYISVMRMYTKTGAITGVDKLIPHGLDAVTADLTIQDLAIARPFAELAVNTCYSNNNKIKHLYKFQLFVNHTKSFEAADLTDIMKRLTLPVLGFGVGINPWRHIHVSFNRKLCPMVDHILEQAEVDTTNIIQYGHGHKVHHGTYGLSHDSLLGLPEDILPEFMDVSTGWQVKGKVVPGQFKYHFNFTNECMLILSFRWYASTIQSSKIPHVPAAATTFSTTSHTINLSSWLHH